ncbi:uncharacterized protein LAESUDRAFT_207336 [Laetiporus sulphureus 93-53]|uniref:F-box domain-containing protein n=1 Tax=Laetiporus sulphureus 93-53 TaxID=1314785 RepID=A0A165DZG5_9APHY|nr:uncharacterized protein LAESUDRAFT_207336 [Laetiporus sulphureus 93-53]KZT05954.1 hypothetical protein LAESUDRAFT_207336 [Laetiporus sulphureus 93-53]
MAADLHFLAIPVEIRLAIYDHYLTEHQRVSQTRQPSNQHLGLLHTCRQIYHEAGPLFQGYVSLRNEWQIKAFLQHADSLLKAQVYWADVANDGRVLSTGGSAQAALPLSVLYLALRRMTSLRRLRVFQCRQGLPVDLDKVAKTRLAIRFEYAMVLSESLKQLSAYELFLDQETRIYPFETVTADRINRLRLSGECHLPASLSTPALRHITLHGVTGNYFDQHNLTDCFTGAALESFSYGLAHRLGFEIRNRHVESLVGLSGGRLRKLVLLSCSRLTSTAIATCLEGLPLLEHFALSLVTVDELRTNFVLSLHPTVAIVKLQVVNAWYAIPMEAEEQALCDALESTVMKRKPPPREIWVSFRNKVMSENGREKRWKAIAEIHRFKLNIGPWEDVNMKEL